MEINLVGKFSNTWGAEHMIKAGLEQLGHEVHGLDLQHSYAILRHIKKHALTVVLQGYGMAPKLVESIRRITNRPVVLWHAEVMSPGWPSDDAVVLAKFEQLRQNAYAFDAIGHNCHCCLNTVRFASEMMTRAGVGQSRPVFWAPNNGVSAAVHRRIEGVEKQYAIGMYGYLSPRRVAMLDLLRRHGIHVEYRRPEDGCFGEPLMRFINQCHTVLNYHYSPTPNTETRLYEALGCGVPVISEPISMPELFTRQHCHVFYFENQHELVHMAEMAVHMAKHDPEYLARLGAEAMTWLHTNASYAQRCQNFLDHVEGYLA